MTETDPEARPEPQEITLYVAYDDGSVGQVTYTGYPDQPPPMDKPGRYIDQAEYLALVAQIEAANEAWLAQQQAAHDAQVKADYDALIAAGIPEATARRLTGYTGV